MFSSKAEVGARRTAPREVHVVAADGAKVIGDLDVPDQAIGVVIFAHGSGSNRNSPRNRCVARRLSESRIGTLLVDLVTADEAEDEGGPDLRRLARRVIDVTRWLTGQEQLSLLPVGYFGASTGAAVALMAAATQPQEVVAIVARGGRPDLVPGDELSRVIAPTLFLVGSLDQDVLLLNRRAMRDMRCASQLEVISGASHLFEETGTLEAVAERAARFFEGQFSNTSPDTRLITDAEDPEVELREDRIGSYSRHGRSALFRDRVEGGQKLAAALQRFRSERPLVLGVPRGGVPVAFEVARALDGELDVAVARKLGAPGREELALGAVTADGTCYLNQEIIDYLGVPESYLEMVIAEQSAEARRRERRFRRGLPPFDPAGRTVIVVDDGIATGATLRAVARSLRQARVKKLVIAVPVGSAESCQELEADADEVICLEQPEPFYAVGIHYRHFGQTSDEEVERLMASSRAPHRLEPAALHR